MERHVVCVIQNRPRGGFWGLRTSFPPRYTREVGAYWPQAVGLIVLSVLTVLPVTGTVCAALCAPAVNAASATANHTSTPRCHEPVSGQQEVRGTAEHDCCRHDGPARETRTWLIAAWADVSVRSMSQDVRPAVLNWLPVTANRIHCGSRPPLGTASPTRTPLILRI